MELSSVLPVEPGKQLDESLWNGLAHEFRVTAPQHSADFGLKQGVKLWILGV